MPPSPATRCSPGRELRAENHKRGRSFEGGILFREKDDDLALFKEMQTREKDNFLLQSNDDFEDTFSTKLRLFSDYKLGISIPVRGESSELLNADVEKNDYDWLLTPPDTPLFPSLDDETQPVNLPQRGRLRSQPISISRSSTMEKSYRSSRGSASPNRLSPSPRSGGSSFQSRGRPSSAPHSSPTPSLRYATPSRRPSPPPSKPSTPVPRSSTPTPRRMSTGSSHTVVSSGARGTSPVKTSRGNSASPKIRAWQSNIPGFSSDAPPNLRTSLADRPASYVRGSSPAARNGRDPSSKSGRQSMSPTASRSVSSSFSHDRLSSHSKGSVVSSGDDDVDSLQSITVGNSDHSASRGVGAVLNNRALVFSKRPTRTTPSSSAPKRSFDSALRQMDHRKGPHNMFRPLLSSVPSSTFYVGKASAAHRAMMSRNSSVTTSSNASSDQGTSGQHDTEGSDQNQDDMASECGKAPCTDVQDEVFVLDKVDAVNEDVGHELHDGSPNLQRDEFNGSLTVDSRIDGSEDFSHHDTSMSTIAMSEVMDGSGDFSEVNNHEDMVLCSRCGHRYRPIKSTEGDFKLCPDCSKSDESLSTTTPVTAIIVADNSPMHSINISEAFESVDSLQPLMAVSESPGVTDAGDLRVVQHEENAKASQTSYDGRHEKSLTENPLDRSLVEEGDQRLSNQQIMGQLPVGYSLPDGDTEGQQMQDFTDNPNLEVDGSEGAGISILLKLSGSGKGPVVQGRSFTASCIPYDDPSYVRDSANNMRSSGGLGSVAASSSVDLVSARQTEIRVQRQLSGRKSDMEFYRYDVNTKHHRSGSSLSGTSSHALQALGLATSKHDDIFDVSIAQLENDAVDLANVDPQEQLLASENIEVDETPVEVDSNNNCQTASELSSHTLDIQLGESPVASLSNFKDSASYGNSEDFPNNVRSISDMELAETPESSIVGENTILTSSVDRVDVKEVPPQNSLHTISEIEIENGLLDSPGSQSDISLQSGSTINELQEPFVPTASDKDITVSATESDTSDRGSGIPGESTVLMGGQGRSTARSPTLEEATDTILFCSSIIYDLACDAASIAMEKGNVVPLEGSQPTVTILGKSNSDRKDLRGRTAGKRSSKSQKARQRRLETDTKPPSSNMESDEKSDTSTTRMVGVPSKGDNMKPPKLESKCNCTVM